MALNEMQILTKTQDGKSEKQCWKNSDFIDRIFTFPLHCGCYDRFQLLGNEINHYFDHWQKGILTDILEVIERNAKKRNDSEDWLIFKGPFACDEILQTILSLSSDKKHYTDESFYKVTLPDKFKVIVQVENFSELPVDVLKSVPVIHYKNLEEDASVFTTLKLFEYFGESEEAFSYLTKEVDRIIPAYFGDIISHHIIVESTIEQVLQYSKECFKDHLDRANYEKLLTLIEEKLQMFMDSRKGSYKHKKGILHEVNEKSISTHTHYFITPAMTWCRDSIKYILDHFNYHVILQGYSGEGLSTFLDYFRRKYEKEIEIFTFHIPYKNSVKAFILFLLENYFLHNNQLKEGKSEVNETGFSNCHLADPSEKELIIDYAGENESLLIVEGIQWLLDQDCSFSFIHMLRYIFECNIIIDPDSNKIYRLKNIRFLLTLSFPYHPKLDENLTTVKTQFIPEAFFQYCTLISFPRSDRDFKTKMIKSELEETLVNSDEESVMFSSLKESIEKFHDIIYLDDNPCNNCEKEFSNRIKSILTELLGHNKNNEISQIGMSSDESSPVDKYSGESPDSILLQQKTITDKIFPETPNLKHFVRLISNLKRYRKLLSNDSSTVFFIFRTEILNVYNSLYVKTDFLEDLLQYLSLTYFEERIDKNFFIFPQNSSLQDFYIEKDYNKILHYTNIGNSTHFPSTYLSQDILKDIQNITLHLTETKIPSHLLLEADIGLEQTLVLKLGLQYLNLQMFNLSEIEEETLQLTTMRDALKHSALNDKPAVIICSSDQNRFKCFKYIYSLIRYNCCEYLWPPHLWRGILLCLKKEDFNHENHYLEYMDRSEIENLKNKFTKNINKNLHICICGTPEDVKKLNENNRSFIRKCIHLKLNKWGQKTLNEIASQIVTISDVSQNIIDKVLQFLPLVHQSLTYGFKGFKSEDSEKKELYSLTEEGEEEEDEEGVKGRDAAIRLIGNEECEVGKVTEQDFIECCKVFIWILRRRRKELQTELKIYTEGLNKLESTNENIDELRTELSQLEPDLKTTQEEALQLTTTIGQQRNIVADFRTQLTEHEEKLKEKSEFVSSLNDEISTEIKEALPEIEAAEKQIKTLDKKDLVEVRVLNKPPELIFQVMSAICLLLNVKPEWPSIKTLLGEPNMTKRLLEIEKESLNETILRKLKKFIEYPKFTPDEVGKLSKPCRPLCAWLRALDTYCQVLRNVEPKKARVIEGERDLNNLQVEQRQLQQKLGQAERSLSEQGARYDACVCRRQQLEGAVKRASGRLQRCSRLATVLADEHVIWQTHAKVLEEQVTNMYGECLLTAVSVAYLGHLNPEKRTKVLTLCIHILKSTNIKINSKNFDILLNLSTFEERQKWVASGLDNDPIPLTQTAMLMASQRPVIILDVHQCFVPWFTRLRESSGNLVFLHSDQKSFFKDLLQANEESKTVAILHTPLKPFNSQLKKVLEKVKSENKQSRENKIIFVTGSCSTIPPEMRVYVTPVSFAMAPKVLEEKLLNEVFERERFDLFEQRTTISSSIRKDEEALEGLELSILRKLSETTLAQLDNEDLLSSFYEAKTTSAEYRTRLAESRRSLLKIGNARDKYRPVAARGRVIFTSLEALKVFSENYVFSLRYFLKLFEECITSSTDEEVAMSFDQRIDTLVLGLTQRISIYVKRSIEVNHRLVFLMGLTANVSYENEELSMTTWKALTKKEITHVDKFFRKIGKYEQEINEVLKDISLEEAIPLTLYDMQTDLTSVSSKGKPSFAPRKISNFNVLLLLRYYKPRMLLIGAREVVKNILNDHEILETNVDVNNLLLAEDRNMGTFIWTDYSSDTLSEVMLWSIKNEIQGLTRIFVNPSFDENLKPGGEDDVSSAIDSAVRLGGAVVIKECANLSWSPRLLDQITKINTENTKTHENFRLILTSQVKEQVNNDLILLCRSLQPIPSSDINGILAMVSSEIDDKLYEHHYQGGLWRKIVWLTASVHTIVYVSQLWNTNSTVSPLTKDVSPISPSFNIRFDMWTQMNNIRFTYDILFKSSMKDELTEDSAVKILEYLYGKRSLWSPLLFENPPFNNLTQEEPTLTKELEPLRGGALNRTKLRRPSARDIIANRNCLRSGLSIAFPEEVGTVSKVNALRIVTSFMNSNFKELNNCVVDRQFEDFKEEFATISHEIMKSIIK